MPSGPADGHGGEAGGGTAFIFASFGRCALALGGVCWRSHTHREETSELERESGSASRDRHLRDPTPRRYWRTPPGMRPAQDGWAGLALESQFPNVITAPTPTSAPSVLLVLLQHLPPPPATRRRVREADPVRLRHLQRNRRALTCTWRPAAWGTARHQTAEWALMTEGEMPDHHLSATGTERRRCLRRRPPLLPHGLPLLQGMGPDGAEFVLALTTAPNREQHLLLTDWFAHTPPEVLAKNFRVAQEIRRHLHTCGSSRRPGGGPGAAVRLKLNREVSDDELGALYEAGLDDAGMQVVRSAHWPTSAASHRPWLRPSRQLFGTLRRYRAAGDGCSVRHHGDRYRRGKPDWCIGVKQCGCGQQVNEGGAASQSRS